MSDVREVVRERYGRIAASLLGAPAEGCCGGGSSCGSTNSRDIGYSEAELSQLPEGANLGLGCGNPQGTAALSPGETVLDLGSGGGIDCFLAAKQVGETGKVIGVDMTPQMLARARSFLSFAAGSRLRKTRKIGCKRSSPASTRTLRRSAKSRASRAGFTGPRETR